MGEWGEIAGKLAKRFEVAAALGMDAVHNPVGSAALAKVLREMGRKLDLAVEREIAARPTPADESAARDAGV